MMQYKSLNLSLSTWTSDRRENDSPGCYPQYHGVYAGGEYDSKCVYHRENGGDPNSHQDGA